VDPEPSIVPEHASHESRAERNIFRTLDPSILNDPDDALWVLQSVRERVKADFPDLALAQRDPNEVNTRVSNKNGKVEGNVWKRLKVIPSI